MHDKRDILIHITPLGVKQLISCETKTGYLKMCKHLYKETVDLDFEVKTNTFNMARKEYISWTKRSRGSLSV